MRRMTGLISLACVTALACSDSTSVPNGMGVLRVQLTDAPFPTDSVASVDIHVVRVDAKLAEGDSTDAAKAATDDSVSAGGWTTIAKPDKSYDLLQLRNGAFTTLGEEDVPPGNYRGFRLIIDPSRSSVTLKGGMKLTGSSSPSVSFPSASRTGIKVIMTGAVTVAEDSVSVMRIDFDLENSFVMRGNSITQNGLLFKPVLKATAVASTS